MDNKTAFWAGAIAALLLIIPQTRTILLNPFNDAMLWILLGVGILLIYLFTTDAKKFGMGSTGRSLMVIAVIAAVIFMLWPGLLNFDRQAALGGEPVEKLVSESVVHTITLQRNQRVTDATLFVDSREVLEFCDDEGVCTESKGSPTKYDIDVGNYGVDFQGEGLEEFDIKKKINLWMQYCGAETCDFPITIKPVQRSFVTVSSTFATQIVTVAPATIIVEREATPPLQFVAIGLAIVAILIIIFLVWAKMAPKSWSRFRKLLAKIGVR